jgi:exodeoxyribonuclease VIII
MAKFDTNQDIKPGFYRMPDAAYREVRALNYSSLKHGVGEKTPMHVHHAWKGEERKQTPNMRIGSAAHCLLLEGNKFDERYIVAGTRTRKAVKGDLGAADTRDVLTDTEWNHASGVADGIARNPDALALVRSAKAEREVVAMWRDAHTGFMMKQKMDLVVFGEVSVWCDIKTCEDASTGGFQKAIESWRYDIQAAMGLEGFHAITGRHLDPVFIAVENSPPYCCKVHRIGERTIRAGLYDYRDVLARLRRADETGEYEYPGGVHPVDARDWFLKRYGDMDE